MDKSISPTTPDAGEYKKYLKEAISDLTIHGKNLWNLASRLESDIIPRGKNFLDNKQYRTVMSFADTSATYNLIKDKMSDVFEEYNKGLTSKPTPAQQEAQKKLIQTYSLYIATSVGLSELEKTGNLEEATFKMDTSDYKNSPFSFDSLDEAMSIQLRESYMNTIMELQRTGSVKNGSDFAQFTKGFLETIKEKALYEKDDGIYKEYLELLEGEPVKVNGLTFKGFDRSYAQKKIDITRFPVLDDVIAMHDVKEAGRKMVDRIMCFDFEVMKNSQDPFPKILYVPGPTGIGKSFLRDGLIRYFVEQGEKYGKPVNAFILTPDMFKTSMMNETTNNILRIFREQVYNPNALNFMGISDFDTIIAGRDAAKASNRIEEANATGAWFNMLSGSSMPKEGRWMIWIDTNYQTDDTALLGRLGKPVIGVGAKTPEEFQDLIEVHLRDGFKKNYVNFSKKDFAEIGKECSHFEKEVQLSGRDILNISESLSAKANGLVLPKGFQTKTYQEQLKYMEKHQVYNEVKKNMFLEELHEYVDGRKEAVDREVVEQKEKLKKQWQTNFEARNESEEMRFDLLDELLREFLPENLYKQVIEVANDQQKMNERSKKSEEKKK